MNHVGPKKFNFHRQYSNGRSAVIALVILSDVFKSWLANPMNPRNSILILGSGNFAIALVIFGAIEYSCFEISYPANMIDGASSEDLPSMVLVTFHIRIVCEYIVHDGS